MPTELIVADFFVYAPVPFAEHCLKDTVAYTKGKKKGGQNSERGAKPEVAQKWERWLHNPCRLGGPTASEWEAKSQVAHKWARWLHNPCRLEGPHSVRAGGRIRSGPQVGKVATQPLPPRGSPPLQTKGQNHKWPTSGLGGYRTPAAKGVATASERGGILRSGPQVGKVGTEPLPPRGSPPLQSGGQNEQWPTSGQGGYITPAASGVPTASERGGESKVAHKWAKWLHNPCRLGCPLHFKVGGSIKSDPQVGKVAT